jgi:predicted CoA-binding protein
MTAPAAANNPPTVAVVGASDDRRKYGNIAVRAFAARGWTVLPVHPVLPAVEGHPAFRSVRELPVRPDRVSLYVPPAVGLKLLPDIAARGCGELWVNPGAESDELVAEARRLGLEPILACSIVSIGESPERLKAEG